MTCRFYILLLFDFQNEEKKLSTFKLCLNCFETIYFRQIDIMSFPQKFYSLSFFVTDDFTLRLH